MEKLCSSCLYVKSFSEFHKHAKRPDGYQCWCKSCRSLRKRKLVVIVNPYYVEPVTELVERPCEGCACTHYGEYGSGRFCSEKCARSFSSKEKREEINDKVSNTLRGRTLSTAHKQKLRKYDYPLTTPCLFCGVEFSVRSPYYQILFISTLG